MMPSPCSNTVRDAQRLQWARSALADPQATLQRASADAGQRSYWRSQGKNVARIVMDAPPGLEDIRPWLRVHALLAAHAIRVPHVLAQDLQAGFLLLEDLGVPTLAHVLVWDERNADTWLDAAVTQLLKLQKIIPPVGSGRFGEALLQRDASLFKDWFLERHLGLCLDDTEQEELQRVQRQLMDNALAQAQVFTHRDFMLRNLMPVADGPAVLDFQDCLVGPIAYDPVSLFKDTSVSWPLSRVDAWLARYHARAAAAGLPVPALAPFLRDADWMGVQRHLKNLGIFSRLSHRDGKHGYLDHVPRFLAYLEEVLPRHPELTALSKLLDMRIKPALAAHVDQARA